MPGFRIWSSKNCSPKEKKSFKLKLRKNNDYRRDDIYLQKKVQVVRVKNARKSLLKALVSKKEIFTVMFLKLCAASFFKVIYTDKNFLPKLKNCCHEWSTTAISRG